MKNLEASSCVLNEPKCDEDKNEITRCQGRDENNLFKYNNILTCDSQLVKSFNILKNPLNGACSRNPYYKKVLFGEKAQMNRSNGPYNTKEFREFDSISVARKGSLDDIKDDRHSLNNYKTWPERFDKTKEVFSDAKTQLDSVNIHVNNGFDSGDRGSEKNEITCQNDRTPVNTPKTNDLKGCLDMSNNAGCAQGTMRLNQALDNISLAYNPITKQLHFVTPKNSNRNKTFPATTQSESESKKGSFSDEGNYSLSNGDKSDSLSSESPRSTLIRSGHQRGTDGGSFSSTVSSLSECSLSGSCVSKDDAADAESQQSCPKVDAVKTKKKGFSGFFSRGVFPWRSAGHAAAAQPACKPPADAREAAAGSPWRLFGGRTAAAAPASAPALAPAHPDPPAPAEPTPASSGASTPQHGRHRRQGSAASNGEGKLFDDLVASSIALIQHNRPSNLPAKDEAEESRHRQEYQRMVEAARRREAREARDRRRQLARQARHEEGLSQALKEWNQTILPAWDTMKNTRKAKDLWWCGIPPAVRGKVWQLAIPNHLNITPQLYHICVERAKLKLVEVKFKKNGYKSNSHKTQLNGLSKDIAIKNQETPEVNCRLKLDVETDRKSSMKPNGLCNEGILDRNIKLSHINHNVSNESINNCLTQQDDLSSRLSDRISKDFSKLRNHSEQNLKRHSLESSMKKNSHSDPDLCEYSNERSMELIQLDIARTFPNLCIFQPGGPYFDVLHELLAAYVCYRPDVGYVQGMSFLAAILILNMDAAEAFVCFANLLNGPVLRAAFTLDARGVQALWAAHAYLLQVQLPALHAHHADTRLGPELYLLEWLYSGFAKAMPLDVACRVWDVFVRDGEEFLFRTALDTTYRCLTETKPFYYIWTGVLHLYQEELLQMDFITASQFLTKLPEDLSADALFKSISCINLTVDKLTFQQLVEKFKEEGCTVLDEDSDR